MRRCQPGRIGSLAGGLEVRTGGDSQATAAQTLGRNRQMVTAGAAEVHPQYFES